MAQSKNYSTAFAIFIVCFIIAACRTFYKVSPVPSGNATELAGSIDSLHQRNRFFILRNGPDAFYIRKARLNADQTILHCELDSLPSDHKLHLMKGRKGKHQFRKTEPADAKVVNEVHLFSQYDSTVRYGSYSLALDKVQKIEVLEKDVERTRDSYILGAIGYSLGAIVVVAAIIAATKSSCPFISGYDGNDFVVQGEVYGGSIYPQLARHDFIPLKMAPNKKGELMVKISNELKERQFTDLARLLVITHERDMRVVAEENGTLHSISNPTSPTSARIGDIDVTGQIAAASDHKVLYMNDTTQANNELIVQFPLEKNHGSANLILDLKNSYWLDLLYGEVAKGFGTHYAKYVEEQKSKSAESLLKWVGEQQIPLEISIRTAYGWKRLASLTTIGPLAFRSIVVPIDLTEHRSQTIDIRLSAGFLFWEIDAIAIDTGIERPFSVETLSPSSAKDELGRNVLSSLQHEDANHLEQPYIGNVATLKFKPKRASRAGQQRSYIFQAKGYYEHIREFTHQPDIVFLNQFKQAGAFANYSRSLYKRMRAQTFNGLATNKN